jgi:hypothetical protein
LEVGHIGGSTTTWHVGVVRVVASVALQSISIVATKAVEVEAAASSSAPANGGLEAAAAASATMPISHGRPNIM